MKKRMLITSVVMVLVVALALSTATYAWFSSNTTVTATNIDISAVASSGSGLLIGMTPNNSALSNTVLLSGTTLRPATPNAVNAFTNADGITIADFQALIDNGNYVTNESGTGVDFSSNIFYVYNVGTQAVTLKLDIAVTNAATVAYDTDGETVDPAVALTPDNIDSYVTASGTVAEGPAKTAITAAVAAYYRNHEAIQSLRIAVVERASSAVASPYNEATPPVFGNRRLVSISQVVGSGGDFGAITGYNDRYEGAFKAALVSTDVYGATLYEGVNYHQGDVVGSPTRDSVGTSKVTDTQNGFSSIAAPGANNYICYEYQIITWLEGWDSDCTNNAGEGQFSIELIINPAA